MTANVQQIIAFIERFHFFPLGASVSNSEVPSKHMTKFKKEYFGYSFEYFLDHISSLCNS